MNAKVITIGNKRVLLMANGIVRIEEPRTDGLYGCWPGQIPSKGQEPFTLATGLPGLLGVIEALKEIAHELAERKARE